MKFLPFLSLVFFFSCVAQKNTNTSKNEINLVLTNWHKAAADANFDAYFNAMTEESVFIGTDALENWNKKNSWPIRNLISIKEKHGVLHH